MSSPFPPFLFPLANYHSRPLNDFLNSITSLSALKRNHARLLTLGLAPSLAAATKLIALAAALSPTMDYARRLFDAMPHPDSFAFNTLIRGYADSGTIAQVPLLYRRMHQAGLSPDRYTFPFVVRSCAVLSALREGRQAHCNAVKHGFVGNIFVQTALIAMYSQNGDVTDAELVFGEMEVRNVVSWTAMIAGYAQNCFFQKALGVFRWMVASGEAPNEVTLTSVLPACNGVECSYSGKSIHGFVVKRGMCSYATLVNALIIMYGKCVHIENARELFDGLPDKSLISWNTMIAVYEQNNAGNEAIELFLQMRAEEVRFDAVTLVSVVAACAGLGDLATGRWVHGLAEESGLETDARVGNALLDMYAKCGSVEFARCAFEKLPRRGVVSWSAMIGAYTAHGHADEAIKLFSEMQAEGIRPNSFTFTSVLAACSHSGRLEEGMRHFDNMRRDYGITPTLEHCACVVDLLGRAGRLKEAYEFVKTMPVRPDAGVWGALLGGCRNHGDFDMAELVMEDIFQSDPHNVTFCVLMSNIYADAGRWEDAARMRKIIKDHELKKLPGYSFVDTAKRSHG